MVQGETRGHYKSTKCVLSKQGKKDIYIFKKIYIYYMKDEVIANLPI